MPADRAAFCIRALSGGGLGRIVDVGCGQGWVLRGLGATGAVLVGTDLDLPALVSARRGCPSAAFVRAAAGLPFRDGSFDGAAFSDVLEHLAGPDQQAVVSELARILVGGATLAVTCPYAGASAVLDPMDVKRRIPGLYGLYRRVSGYVPTTPAEIGHRHLTDARLHELLDGHFEPISFRYCGLFEGVLVWVITIGERLRLLPCRAIGALDRLRAFDSGSRMPRWLAYNVHTVWRRRADA